MPGRKLTAPRTQRRTKSNPRKRSLNALAIASSTNPEDLKVRQHRLGESEGRSKAGNHATTHSSAGNGLNSGRPPNSPEKGRFDLDVDSGSDSEGNTWRLGQVGSDQDSDIDSDEAMGASDEERFEGFVFRGSSSGKLKCRRKENTAQPQEEARSADLEEPEGSDGESEGTGDSLGEDAVDLAAMLDASTEDEQAFKKRKAPSREQETDTHSRGATREHASSDEGEDGSVLSISEDEEGPDPAKLSALRNLISSLEPTVQEPSAKRQRVNEANESRVPSEYSLGSIQKLTVEDLLPSVTNHSLKRSLRIIAADGNPKGSSSRNSIPSKLEVPLARRQQDRLDRSAAYEKSKETLNRWIDTIKHMRRAEHLSFPLPGPSGETSGGARRLPPTAGSEPLNELETTIQSILQESGLVTSNGEADESTILSFEEQQTNKMPLEEVQTRRAQLRMARELLFREEVRAKRIKKIKSKSYRRVHRKQREKTEKGVREALALAGVNTSDGDEDGRRRAEERMGARHRESKWAKTVKGSRRGAWDEDTRAGIVEMARRGEELRRRIGGKQIRDTGDNLELSVHDTSDSDSHSCDSGGEGSEGDERKKLLYQLQEVGSSLHSSGLGPRSTSKLFSLKFMQKAEAARKAENDAAASKLQRELAGDSHSSDEEQATTTLVGRKKYGSTKSLKRIYANSGVLNEPGGGSRPGEGDTIGTRLDVVTDMKGPLGTKHPAEQAEDLPTAPGNRGSETIVETKAAINPWMDRGEIKPQHPRRRRNESGGRKQSADRKANSETKASRTKASSIDGTPDDVIIDSSLAFLAPRSIHTPKETAVTNSKVSSSASERKSVTAIPEMGRSDSEDEKLNMLAPIRDQELMKRAFAGDDVVGEFEEEKRKIIHEEEEKVIDNTLPGWGNWTGAGVGRKGEKRNRGKVISKLEGIKEGNRRDAKLDRVIVNEKQVKKNAKYLASSLPHPFETREQYERSLRLPVGPEWTTKETFQNATKPRVILRQGRVIDPMCNPFM
ncbi:hypothetical protein GP486_000624 [Trichoglossum hirsutum]|uniref:Uncharacterized protein n=1 Tax=Trichoglossum hirsutum TaxID=265104 RepID=A0A9P8RTD8_9PEZI|nr:hypothetical protein GP486_000624 [Trichoglossum hirsutum]